MAGPGWVACLRHDARGWAPLDPGAPALTAALADGNGFVWLALADPPPALLAEVQERVGAHPAGGIGDDGSAFPVGTVAVDAAGPGAAVSRTGRLSVALGPRYLLTVTTGAGVDLAAVVASVSRRPAADQWSALAAVVGEAVAGYPAVLERVADEVDDLEEHALSDGPHKPVIQRVYLLDRELVTLRRVVAPTLRPLGALAEDPAVPHRARRRLRRLHADAVQAAEQVNSYDDLLNSILQARLAQISIDQNDDMRKIASWAAILAAQTVVAGVYGMNFRDMPELGWPYGYPSALALMLAAGGVLFWRLRRSGWL